MSLYVSEPLLQEEPVLIFALQIKHSKPTLPKPSLETALSMVILNYIRRSPQILVTQHKELIDTQQGACTRMFQAMYNSPRSYAIIQSTSCAVQMP